MDNKTRVVMLQRCALPNYVDFYNKINNYTYLVAWKNSPINPTKWDTPLTTLKSRSDERSLTLKSSNSRHRPSRWWGVIGETGETWQEPATPPFYPQLAERATSSLQSFQARTKQKLKSGEDGRELSRRPGKYNY